MGVKLEKNDLTKSWLLWVTFGQQCYNFEIMQGLGFAHAMCPIIKRLYPNDTEKRKEALERHLNYYNTENNWGASIAGIVASMEEEKANGAAISDSSINSIKAALMGPLASIGDTVTQSLVKTVLLGIACDLALNGNILGPILFVVLMSVYTLGFSHFVYFTGYKSGKASVTRLLAGGKLSAVTDALGVLGIMVLGSLVASSISISTPLVIALGQTTVELQTVLDTILPKLLPLLAFLGCYRMVNKGMKPVKIILILFVVGIVCGLLGILA